MRLKILSSKITILAFRTCNKFILEDIFINNLVLDKSEIFLPSKQSDLFSNEAKVKITPSRNCTYVILPGNRLIVFNSNVILSTALIAKNISFCHLALTIFAAVFYRAHQIVNPILSAGRQKTEKNGGTTHICPLNSPDLNVQNT